MRKGIFDVLCFLMFLSVASYAQVGGPGTVVVGGGGSGDGVTGLTSCADGTALADNAILRGDGTTKCQGSTVTVADSTGNLQWEGTTADAFEGNFTFADPTADWTWAWGATGNVTIPGNIQGPTSGFTIFGGTSTTADLIFQTTTGVGASGSDMRFLVGNNGALEAMRLQYDGQAVFRTINIGSWDGTDVNSFAAADQSKFYFGSNMEIGWGNSSTPAGYSYLNDAEFGRFAAGVLRCTDGTNNAVRCLIGGGTAVASATALPIPTGSIFHVTGTTNITSITSTNFQSGVCVTLIFDGVLTFTDGSNLKLAGDFVTTADDTIHLCYDGTNWYEEGRSIN